MAYNANIPQATDQISQSQSDILANFQALSGAASNTLPYLLLGPEQVSAPVTSSTQMSIFEKTGANTLRPELAIGQPSSGDIVEFTEWGQDTTTSGGYTRFPSGVLFKWGTVSTASSSSSMITFPVNTGAAGMPNINKVIPAFTTLFNVSVSVYDSTSAIAAYGSVSAANTANFTVKFNATNGHVVRYFAVGL